MPLSDVRAVALIPAHAEQGIAAMRQPGPARSAAGVAADGAVDRRKGRSGNLGNRRTDNWMPYSSAFVAQLLAQQLDEQQHP